MCIYIYIERERESERDFTGYLEPSAGGRGGGGGCSGADGDALGVRRCAQALGLGRHSNTAYCNVT